jgi:O-antigen/teichoic acid export membrane protein
MAANGVDERSGTGRMTPDRTRNAIVAAAFSYIQFALALAGGLFVIPLILGRLDARTYGVWLATGEGLAYVAMVDLGVFAVLPWMVAAADGRRDRAALGRLTVDALVFGTIVAIGYVGLVALLWPLVPGALGLTDADRAAIEGPLAVLVVVTAVAFPLRPFRAILTGLQDVVFNGAIAVLQTALTIGLTVVLILQGWGLYSLAIAAAVPPAITTVLAVVRTRALDGRLFESWQAPTLAGMTTLVREGIGGWLGVFGVQLLVASNALIIAWLVHPAAAVMYVCTAKVSQVFLHVAWVLPDSGLVGLAQLHAERRPERTREIIIGMLRLHMILSGAVALVIVMVNSRFVTAWVGAEFFGGEALNALLALACLSLSVTHGVAAAAAVVGNRLGVGGATLFNGVVHVVLALALGARFGLEGVALATAISGLLTALPIGLRFLRMTAGVGTRAVMVEVIVPWTRRASPVFAMAVVLRWLDDTAWVGLAGAGILGILYVARMRSYCVDLPLSGRFRGWLARAGLLPAPDALPAALDGPRH